MATNSRIHCPNQSVLLMISSDTQRCSRFIRLTWRPFAMTESHYDRSIRNKALLSCSIIIVIIIIIIIIIILPERRRTITMQPVGRIVKYSLLQKLMQISVRHVLHDNRQWLPLSNDAKHLCYIGITDATQLLHGLVKRSSAQTTAVIQIYRQTILATNRFNNKTGEG